MSEKKHSPEPWTEGESPDNHWWEYASIESEGRRIAAVMETPYSKCDPEANLKLILSAPLLLAERDRLRALLKCCTQCIADGCDGCRWEQEKIKLVGEEEDWRDTFEPRRILDCCGHPAYLCDDACPQFESNIHGPGRGCLLMSDEWEGLDEYCSPAYFAQRMLREKMGVP